ncbi:MAG: hypothetical protein U1D68_00900 [Arthrobacter sp.]|nr:hypothetical protein [Arthrobacter sp.]MDZ4352544.1 hypothetical protein [Arthrobacter sp.]
MSIAEAQCDVRRVYAGGFYGQLVSGAVWLMAAGAATWFSPPAGVGILFFGGMLIFPLTTLVIRLSGRPSSLPAGHPMAGLAMQIAFTVPIGFVVVVTMLGGHSELFFPASMVIVGAHYLPFVFLYGMRLFAVLSAAMVVAGVLLLYGLPVPSAVGGWFTGALLVAFAFLLRASARSLENTALSRGH